MERGSSSAGFLAGVNRAREDLSLHMAREVALTFATPPPDFAIFCKKQIQQQRDDDADADDGNGTEYGMSSSSSSFSSLALSSGFKREEVVEELSEYEQQRLAKVRTDHYY